MPLDTHRSDQDLLVFISSKMDAELEHPRAIAKEAIEKWDIGRPWMFEYSPASTDSAEEAYLRKIEEADFVIWLVGRETTQPVIDEVNHAIACGCRLLVFKMPVEQYDTSTQELLQHISTYVKWKDIDDINDLPTHIAEALNAELVKALRDPAPPARKSKLYYEYRYSIARCKAAWITLGVDEPLADRMANEHDLGSRLELPAPGLHSVMGDQGVGKSLAVERIFQTAIMNAIQDSSQPFPIFVQARELKQQSKPISNNHFKATQTHLTLKYC